MAKLNQTQLKALSILRRRLELRDSDVNFERAGFPISGWVLPTKELEATEFIRVRTRTWRETWVLPIIDALIAGDTHLLRQLVE